MTVALTTEVDMSRPVIFADNSDNEINEPSASGTNVR